MSKEEKIDQAKGAVKEAVGKVTGDKKIEAEGAAEKTTAKVKEVVKDAKDAVEEKVDEAKDAVKEVTDKVTDDKKVEKAAEKAKEVAEDVKDVAKDKIKKTKDAVKEGVDKLAGDKNPVAISIVSSVITAVVDGVVVSLFFVKKKRKSFFDRKYAMKIIDNIL